MTISYVIKYQVHEPTTGKWADRTHSGTGDIPSLVKEIQEKEAPNETVIRNCRTPGIFNSIKADNEPNPIPDDEGDES